MRITMTAVSTLDELVRWLIDPRTMQVRIWLPLLAPTGHDSLIKCVHFECGKDPEVVIHGAAGHPPLQFTWDFIRQKGRISVTYEEQDVTPETLDVMEVGSKG